jgi:hypothetical protein
MHGVQAKDAGALAYVPAVQLLQPVASSCPSVVENLPGLQNAHVALVVAELAVEYFPASHRSQVAAPGDEKLPA